MHMSEAHTHRHTQLSTYSQIHAPAPIHVSQSFSCGYTTPACLVGWGIQDQYWVMSPSSIRPLEGPKIALLSPLHAQVGA